MFRKRRDGLLALETDDLVLEHAARSVRVHPEGGIIQNTRGGTLHVPSALLVRGDDLASVEPVGFELGDALHEIDGTREQRRVCARLNAVGKTMTQGRVVAARVARV